MMRRFLMNSGGGFAFVTAPAMYPFRFQPILRRYIWGGRRLGTELGKAIGEGDDYAESWEVVDHGADQSVVRDGALAGMSLAELTKTRGQELLGKHHPQKVFPLLFKFLDARRTLSVQVHPDDARASKLDPPDLGKTEAWIILAAAPGAKIYAGLKPGVDHAALEDAVRRGECEKHLHSFEPEAGDCVFLPAGAVHAIGEGLLVAEIMQASDTTYRLYDWNRTGADGKPRPLHIEAALDATDFERGPIDPQVPRVISPGRSRLVECDKFVLDRLDVSGTSEAGTKNAFSILAMIEGEAEVAGAPMRRGETVLVPAAVGVVPVEPRGGAVLLEARLP